MEITEVEKDKRNKGRYLVYVDSQYSFSVSEDDYLSLNLYEKKEITDAEIDYIKNTVNFREAKSAAIRYLSLKLRCEREVRRKLQEEGYDAEIIDNSVEELKSIGYINDRMYAQKFVFDRSKLKPKAKKLIKFELLSKRIEETIIDEVLDDWQVDEFSIAEGLARRKFGKYNLGDEKVVKKIFSFLHHRGYSFELIEKLVNKLKSEIYR